MPCRFASSGTVATSRSASRAILALNVASNFLRDLVISVLHRLRQSRTLHTLTFGPISGVHFKMAKYNLQRIDLYVPRYGTDATITIDEGHPSGEPHLVVKYKKGGSQGRDEVEHGRRERR